MPATSSPPPSQEILVLGGGSAGFLAAITLKTRLPTLNVRVLHSSDIPIIGVGEGTTFTMPIFLHGYLGIDPREFHANVHPTYKLGIQFLWGPRPRFHYSFTNQLDGLIQGMPKPRGFYCYENYDYADITGALMANGRAFERQQDGGPVVPTSVAYHIENENFVHFLEGHTRRMGIEIIDDKVDEVEQNDDGISALKLASGNSVSADLFIDCSGFRSVLLREALGEPWVSYESSLYADRAVAGGWDRSDEPILPFTTAETMNAGWCWQIEHDHFLNRGYVYSSRFLSDDEAEKEFREKNPKIDSTRVIKFDSGATERAWVKNVVALGNSNGFVEPLEATSLAIICDHAAKLVHTLADANFQVSDASRRFFNRYTERNWSAIRRFLAMHYKFNKRIDTEFWRACIEETDLAGAEEIVDYYQSCGPSLLWASEAMGPLDPFGWEGYLVMLVGQKVPFETQYQPGDQEQKVWNQYMTSLAQRAQNSLTMRQATEMIRSPQWAWRPDFYASAVRW